jgi:hypothetical protein
LMQYRVSWGRFAFFVAAKSTLVMQQHIFVPQLLFGFPVFGVIDNAVDGADADAGGLLVMSHAFGAQIRLYLVDFRAKGNGAVRTLRFTHVAVDARVFDE